MSEERVFPVLGYSYKGGIKDHYTKEDDNYDEIIEYCNAYESYNMEKEKIRDEIFATISRYRTVESLCKGWMEIASVLPYIGIQLDSQPSPGVSMQVLNKKCSLPIKSCRICGMLDPEGDNVCPLKGEVSEDFVCDHWVKRV